MLAPVSLEPITLAARSLQRVENGRGTLVACVNGVAWVTQERDSRDIILAAGQSVVLDRPGVAVVFALKDAMITVGAAADLPATAAGSLVSTRTQSRAPRAWT